MGLALNHYPLPHPRKNHVVVVVPVLSKQRAEALLLEMPVVRMRLSDGTPSHCLRGDTVRQTVALAWTRLVETQPGQVYPALRFSRAARVSWSRDLI